VQVGVGFLVWLCLPWLAKGIALLALPLVAAYPFMKRITWFPQVWLGLTFNWAVLVAYAAKTGTLSLPLFIFYLGLIFWTVGYDTIYACQDMEDDAMVGIKSTALRFGGRVKLGIGVCYGVALLLWFYATGLAVIEMANPGIEMSFIDRFDRSQLLRPSVICFSLLGGLFFWQVWRLNASAIRALRLFKSNVWIAVFLISIMLWLDTLYAVN
jgi:4-hydroxybenzoate polyprenyltransferase